MLQQVFQTIARYAMWPKGAHLLVAVSGGADSMALLHALLRCQKRDSLRLTIVHLHHGIRRRAADRDCAFVQRVAEARGVPFIADRADVPALARRTGQSIEMAARAARYDFFRRVARETGAYAVATAHTSDDQAETVLLRLLRGSGLQGLGGMASVTTLGGLRIVRPLLEVSREEIEAFLRKQRVDWCEDATNRDMVYARNKVRHRLIPLLEREYQPALRKVLCRTATVLREDEALIAPVVKRATARAKRADGALSVSALTGMKSALRHRIILDWLRENGVPEARLGFDVAARVETLFEGGKSLELIKGVKAVVAGDVLSVVKGQTTAVRGKLRAVALAESGSVGWGSFRISTSPWRGILRPPRARVGAVPAEASVRAPGEGERLVVRSWRAGDRIAPVGMSGSVKLQDLFVDQKVPKAARAEIPVVACGKTVVWVPGYRVARDWAVASEVSRSVRVRVERK